MPTTIAQLEEMIRIREAAGEPVPEWITEEIDFLRSQSQPMEDEKEEKEEKEEIRQVSRSPSPRPRQRQRRTADRSERAIEEADNFLRQAFFIPDMDPEDMTFLQREMRDAFHDRIRGEIFEPRNELMNILFHRIEELRDENQDLQALVPPSRERMTISDMIRELFSYQRYVPGEDEKIEDFKSIVDQIKRDFNHEVQVWNNRVMNETDILQGQTPPSSPAPSSPRRMEFVVSDFSDDSSDLQVDSRSRSRSPPDFEVFQNEMRVRARQIEDSIIAGDMVNRSGSETPPAERFRRRVQRIERMRGAVQTDHGWIESDLDRSVGEVMSTDLNDDPFTGTQLPQIRGNILDIPRFFERAPSRRGGPAPAA